MPSTYAMQNDSYGGISAPSRKRLSRDEAGLLHGATTAAPVSAESLRVSRYQQGTGGGAFQLKLRTRRGFYGCDAQIQRPS